jgi:hypothetical protein
MARCDALGGELGWSRNLGQDFDTRWEIRIIGDLRFILTLRYHIDFR